MSHTYFPNIEKRKLAALFDTSDTSDGDGEDGDVGDGEDGDVGVSWKSKRYPALDDVTRARLPNVLEDVLKSNSFRSIGEKPGFYKFVHLVTKKFHATMTKYKQSGVLHIEIGCFK